MLIRIVQMTFQTDQVQMFLDLFNQTKQSIRNFPGCQHLELLQDTDAPQIFYTYSYWDTQEALEMYRQSTLFKSVWSKTKVLFAERPQAFSGRKIETVNA